MAERTFFSLRYVLPGYTFILVIILVSFPSLQTQFFQEGNIEFWAAFLAFLSVLGGGALGFLVSQIWHVIFNRFIYGKYYRFPKVAKFVKEEFEAYKITDDHKKLIFFMDYLARLGRSSMKNYTQRRYDLMHLCGSTFTTLIIGFIFGFIIKGEIFQANINYDLIVISIVGALAFLLFKGLLHAMQEHSMGFEQIVREVVTSKIDFSKEKVVKAFPKDWFKSEESSNH